MPKIANKHFYKVTPVSSITLDVIWDKPTISASLLVDESEAREELIEAVVVAFSIVMVDMVVWIR